PIGVFESKKNFNNHEIKVKAGDCIYIFSDGYVDQFGGKRDQKFTSRQLRDLLLYIHQKPMKEQHQILDDTIEKWRDGKDQIDDICLMGVKV
ncbi:MAG: SpoIIE family protein phosphatase, partial [Bacteroidia bacterium]|nr:SpoIIE family protein phosphatase [Bacteroidia bacterium]